MALVGQFAPGSGTTGRAGIHHWGSDIVGNGASDPFSFLGSDDTLNHTNGPRVLGEDAPGKLESAKKNLATRLQGKGGGDVKGHRVGSIGAVGAGFGDGSGKFGEQALGRGCSFNPVESGGKNQSGDDFDFALPGPRPVAEAEAKLNGFHDALVERGANQASAQAQVAPKVSHRHEDLHFSTDMYPVHGFEEGSGGGACAEKVALGSRDLSAQSMKVPKCGRVSVLELAGMVRPYAENK